MRGCVRSDLEIEGRRRVFIGLTLQQVQARQRQVEQDAHARDQAHRPALDGVRPIDFMADQAWRAVPPVVAAA